MLWMWLHRLDHSDQHSTGLSLDNMDPR
jgi:hypothetical protein